MTVTVAPVPPGQTFTCVAADEVLQIPIAAYVTTHGEYPEDETTTVPGLFPDDTFYLTTPTELAEDYTNFHSIGVALTPEVADKHARQAHGYAASYLLNLTPDQVAEWYEDEEDPQAAHESVIAKHLNKAYGETA
ncbi:hypothetical protein [Gordonia terrae]